MKSTTDRKILSKMTASAKKYQVAVILYTYNSDLKKTLSTLRSAIFQQGIKFQIVVADDGSTVNNKEEIEKVFEELNFKEYSFSILKTNMGITDNLRHAFALTDAEYIKILSPGDYLSDFDVLSRLYVFAKNCGCKVSFGDAVWFKRGNNGIITPMENYNNAPCLLRPYDKGRIREQRKNCLLLNDFILGAAVFTESDTYRDYINRLSGHVKYFEDNALRLMIFDGIVVRHYPGIIMWYEFGEGISTCNSPYWLKHLYKDYDETNKLICNNIEKNCILKKRIQVIYSKGLSLSSKRYFSYPEIFINLVIRKFFSKKGIHTCLSPFMKKIMLSEYGGCNGKE